MWKGFVGCDAMYFSYDQWGWDGTHHCFFQVSWNCSILFINIITYNYHHCNEDDNLTYLPLHWGSGILNLFNEGKMFRFLLVYIFLRKLYFPYRLLLIKYVAAIFLKAIKTFFEGYISISSFRLQLPLSWFGQLSSNFYMLKVETVWVLL